MKFNKLNYSVLSLFILFYVSNHIVRAIEVEVRPRCVPLESENINSNPYHHSLLSEPNARIQTFFNVNTSN